MSVERLSAALADRYRVEREAGAGGMATVYLATDLRHSRSVALKVLRPELAATMGPARFLREIEIAARLQHPHILPLLDSGEADGFLYYVMPFVEGESLRARLVRHGELPIHDAVKILMEVADALGYAHGQGIVHRDVKPENVLMSGRHALVTDFGVAKAVSEATGRQTLTTAGVALGTPTYMAPEQATADPQLDHRVDIYALGVLGYEMLAGRPPFVGRGAQEVLAGHLAQTPQPVLTFRPTVPAALDELILKCIAKRPADRWQSAEDLMQHLEPFGSPSTGVTPAQLTPARRLPAHAGYLVVGALGLLAVGVVGSLLLRGPAVPRFEVGRRVQVTRSPGVEFDPAISPDGQLVVYSVSQKNGQGLVVQQLDGGNPLIVARDTPLVQFMPAWSPDGRQIAFTSERGLEVVPSLGGRSRVVKRGLQFTGGFSPDGREILASTADSLLAVNVESGVARGLAAIRESHSFAWSPNGKWVAFVAGNATGRFPGNQYGNTAPSTIYVLPSAGGPLVAVSDSASANTSPTWIPGRRALAYASNREGGGDAWLIGLDREGRPDGEPTRLTTGLGAQLIGLSQSGNRFLYAPFSERSNIYRIALPKSGSVSIAEARAMTTGNQTIERMDVSPDGRWLVFDSDRGGNYDLWRMALPGGEPEQLTRTPESDFWPSISSEGGRIVFHRVRNGRRQLFVIPAGGGAADQITPDGPIQTSQAEWSPDGTRLQATRGDPAQGNKAWIPLGPTGWGNPVMLIDSLTDNLAWSPDGQLIAGSGRISGEGLLLSREGRVIRTLTPPNPARFYTYPQWSPDGSRVYFVELDLRLEATAIVMVPATGGAPRAVVRFDDPTRAWHRFGFRVHRDQIYLTLGERESDVWIADVRIR
jgi:serine/threonine-protein kinase